MCPPIRGTILESCIRFSLCAVDRLDCLFGCAGCEDVLEHYLVCDPLWTLIVCFAKLPMTWLSVSAIGRLAILDPSPTAFNLIAIASRCYHAIRLEHKDKVVASQMSKDFGEILELLILHIRVQVGELL